MTSNILGVLVDHYGDLDARIKALEDEKYKVRDELLGHVQDVPVEGLRWTVTKIESTTRRLDTKAVKEYLGDKVSDFENLSRTTQLRVKQTKILGQTAEGE